ncbi:MAG: tetratricopeptide repeat protein, partial [Bryobacteraceae bacterium]
IRGDNVAAIPLLRQAIGLDPNFAMAFVTLGACYNNLGQTERAVENTRRAYELRERVSQREKFFIISYYETNATGNLEAARKELGLWAQAYPRDFAAPRQLSNVSNFLGDYQNALAAAQQVLRLDPGNGAAYCGLSINYLALNRLDEARATAREAHNLGAPMADYYLYYIDFLQHDAAGMERDVATLMRKPGYEDLALGMESDTAAYAGKFARARELTRRAAASAERADEPEPAANYLAEAALRDALVGNLGLAMRQAQAGLALSNGRDVEAMSAMALALVGDSNQARRLASDLAKRFPEDTLAQIEYLPMIQACTGLGIGHGADGASKAIAALAVAARYELGVTNGAVLWQFNAPYLRGEAYLAARQGTAAAVEFRKILDHPGMFTTDITAALARLDLGRAYALVGDNAKARTAYQDFLALWKDADPDIPVLNHAKAEYAKLAGP